METFTIREAAERCDVSYQLMRKRVDRGTVSTVKRDGVRRVPRVELERTGLWPGSQQAEQSDSLELATLRAHLAEAQQELTDLRPLAAKMDAERRSRELAEQAVHEHRATALAAEARLSEAEQEAEKERAAAAAALEPLTNGGFIASIRALRALRSRESSSAGGGVTPARA